MQNWGGDGGNDSVRSYCSAFTLPRDGKLEVIGVADTITIKQNRIFDNVARGCLEKGQER